MKHRTFRHPEVLQAMLYLRLSGWPLKELAFIFDCEHTSIRKACIRSGLNPEVRILPRPQIKMQRVIIDFDGERLNPGKSYKEYLEEAKRRRQPKLKNREINYLYAQQKGQ